MNFQRPNNEAIPIDCCYVLLTHLSFRWMVPLRTPPIPPTYKSFDLIGPLHSCDIQQLWSYEKIYWSWGELDIQYNEESNVRISTYKRDRRIKDKRGLFIHTKNSSGKSLTNCQTQGVNTLASDYQKHLGPFYLRRQFAILSKVLKNSCSTHMHPPPFSPFLLYYPYFSSSISLLPEARYA
jgi:hypothetical protein